MGGVWLSAVWLTFLFFSHNLKVWKPRTPVFSKVVLIMVGLGFKVLYVRIYGLAKMIELHLRLTWTMESTLIFIPKLFAYDLVLLKICNCIKFCQIYVIMWSFAKFMEVCEVLPKLRIFIYLFPNLWNYVKFCQNFEKLFIFAKFMEVCQFLPKL